MEASKCSGTSSNTKETATTLVPCFTKPPLLARMTYGGVVAIKFFSATDVVELTSSLVGDEHVREPSITKCVTCSRAPFPNKITTVLMGSGLQMTTVLAAST